MMCRNLTVLMVTVAAAAMPASAYLPVRGGGYTTGGWYLGGGLSPTSYAEVGMYTDAGSSAAWLLTNEDGEGSPNSGTLIGSINRPPGTDFTYFPDPLVSEVHGSWLRPDPDHPGQRGHSGALAVRHRDGRLIAKLLSELIPTDAGVNVADGEVNLLGKYYNTAPANTGTPTTLNLSLHGLVEAHEWSTVPGPNYGGQASLFAEVNLYVATPAFESKKRGVGWGPIFGEALGNFLGPQPGEPDAYLTQIGNTAYLEILPDGSYQTVTDSISWESEGGEIFYVSVKLKGRIAGYTGQIIADNTFGVSFEDNSHIGIAENVPEPTTLCLLAPVAAWLMRRR